MRLAQQAGPPPPHAAGYSPLLAASRIKSSVKVWYPTPGYRHHASGTMSLVGNGGYSWSSTVSSTDAYYLGFRYAILYPSNASYRAFCWQVRCLRE